MKMPTAQFLEQRKAIILSDLKMKVEAEDWHGVADAAMDLREIEAQAKVILSVMPIKVTYTDAPQAPCEHEWRYSIVTDQEFCQLCHAKREVQNVVQTTI